MKKFNPGVILILTLAGSIALVTYSCNKGQTELKGKYAYADFKPSRECGSCHQGIYEQWRQSMMSQAYTHHWDEIEYFTLAVAHSEVDPTMKDPVDGCNGCHAPLAWMAGILPPARPAENTMANESVSCEVCHLMKSAQSDPPFNFSYFIEPGNTKYAAKVRGVESPYHKIEENPFFKTTEFCGNCHNEKNPFGIWVKSTQLEWKEGPYAEEGVTCQDCHMPRGQFRTAVMGGIYEDVRLHLFHGAHDNGKIRGTIELRVQSDLRTAKRGDTVVFTVALFNQKAGHKFPTGSVEDRIVWLNVEAVDENGIAYHLTVDKKGFEGEDYTISGEAMAYRDLGIPLGIDEFAGVQRDGIPFGNRIFRMPYFDNNGDMTIMQWNTRALGVDYRIGPRETKLETFTFLIPENVAPGTMKVTATLNYQLLVKPVADFLKVPADESEVKFVNDHFTTITINQ